MDISVCELPAVEDKWLKLKKTKLLMQSRQGENRYSRSVRQHFRLTECRLYVLGSKQLNFKAVVSLTACLAIHTST